MSGTFLIADDSKAKMLMLLGFLKHMKWKGDIITAETSEEAIDLIQKQTDIAAAFIDYNIPTADGPTIIRHLHAKFPKARIALVTASDNRTWQQEAMDAGAETHVCTSKPSDEVERQLMAIIQEWAAS